ncbi:MAG: SiaB family protein kinase [Candidatus Cloacimonetes bacterium]|jgi:hypothetical protein|nr:SiaB family protein kinase [Candidatus Cloacimonadota bacterium]MDD4156302.1 SiaB family protein kinase [Candidatus Cloacimonadota bacterium]
MSESSLINGNGKTDFVMTDSDLFDLYSSGGLEKTILMFKGILTQDILVMLAEMLTNNLSTDPRQKTTKKMFSIFVELAQNIHRYSYEKITVNDKLVGAGIVLVNEFESYYSLISGNVIEHKVYLNLKKNIDYLNSLDGDQLKQLRKDKLKQKREENEKGAGVGLIDIKRKATSNIILNVKKLENNMSFVSFFIKLDKEY